MAILCFFIRSNNCSVDSSTSGLNMIMLTAGVVPPAARIFSNSSCPNL